MTINLNKVKGAGDYSLGHLGSSADGAPKYAKSYAAEDELMVGLPVLHGTNADTQVKAAGVDVLDTDSFAGFVLLDPSAPDGTYSAGDSVSVLKFGVMRAASGASEAGVVGQQVVYTNATKTLSSAAEGTDLAAMFGAGVYFVPGARWSKASNAGSIGEIELGF